MPNEKHNNGYSTTGDEDFQLGDPISANDLYLPTRSRSSNRSESNASKANHQPSHLPKSYHPL